MASDYRSFHLSPVASLGLKELVDEVKNGNQSNQTAGRKRKGIDTDAPEERPKRHLQEGSLSQLAARAREQRKFIREIITDVNGFSDQHSSSVVPSYPLPGAVDKLSDPAFGGVFPFPFIGFAVPNRFKAADGNWQYMGRTKFKELLQKVEDVRVSKVYNTTWLYGTPGYGKSHLLAALVCYLAAQDVRVVYIPDCGELLEDFIEYVRAAMLFAWADDITTQEEIMALKTEKDIGRFFKGFMGQQSVTFVVDQMNALNASTDEAQHGRRWLNHFMYSHKSVISSSANYTEYLEQSIEQSSNDVLRVYGGLDKREMDQWWNRHKNVDMGGYDRERVEDITGSIPLLLDKCVVDGKIDLTVPDLQDIYDKAMAFVKTSNPTREKWSGEWYCDFMMACFCHKRVPYGWSGNLDLVDHRYFYRSRYRNNWYGGYACGLARNAVADQLLLKGIDFVDTKFPRALDRFVGNPSVVRFIIEHVVLSSIRSRGLSIGEGIAKEMVLKLLEDPPEFDKVVTKGPVLYRPKSFNSLAVGGIIFWIKPKGENGRTNQGKNDKTNEGKNDKTKANQKGKLKLLILPLQIMLAPETHSDSRERFFQQYGQCITDLSEFDLELQFLWINPKLRDGYEYPAIEDPPRPKHRERYITFEDVNNDIWEEYQKYEAARERLEKNEPKGAEVATTEGATIKAAQTEAAPTKPRKESY